MRAIQQVVVRLQMRASGPNLLEFSLNPPQVNQIRDNWASLGPIFVRTATDWTGSEGFIDMIFT